MIQRPLACPLCTSTVLRAADTGAFALECTGCRALMRFGPPGDVPSLDRKPDQLL
jgi:hypothetical protein